MSGGTTEKTIESVGVASKASVSHRALEVMELRDDRALAVECLKAAMQTLDDPNDRAAGFALAEAYGGLGGWRGYSAWGAGCGLKPLPGA